MIAPVRRQPKFHVGQLVRHRRYDYRGVVVGCDEFCKAPDDWYHANQTQPDRQQPWYHVLVHGTHSMTYAAQTSLQADNSGKPIEHPLVDYFFSRFDGEQYIRNDQTLTGW